VWSNTSTPATTRYTTLGKICHIFICPDLKVRVLANATTSSSSTDSARGDAMDRSSADTCTFAEIAENAIHQSPNSTINSLIAVMGLNFISLSSRTAAVPTVAEEGATLVAVHIATEV
jgi:hypothetical protein